MSKKALRVLVAVAAAFALMLSLLSPAGAEHRDSHDPPGQSEDGGGGNEEQTCGGTHVFPEDDLVADVGNVIEVVCIKAGSANQGDQCGPVTVVLDSPREVVTYEELTSVCEGRAISHYSILEQGPPPVGCEVTDTCPVSCEVTDTCPDTSVSQPVEEEEPVDEPEPTTDPSGVLGAGAANAQVGAPSFTG